MSQHEKIDYVEFPSTDLSATKAFFAKAFGWTFEDYGPEYTAFANQGLDGGFFKSSDVSLTDKGAALIVFYSDNLEATQAKIEAAGGSIVKAIFRFLAGVDSIFVNRVETSSRFGQSWMRHK